MLKCILFIFVFFPFAVNAEQGVRAVTVAEGFEHPWALDFLPGGDMLVTERGGALILVRSNGDRETVSDLPDSLVSAGQGGLLDVLVHPDFTANRTIFFSYSGGGKAGLNTEVARANLNGPRITDLEIIFKAQPKVRGGANHFGSRLLWHDGLLYVTLGDRFHMMDQAQNPDNHLGTVVRLKPDGSVPDDNPFTSHESYKPEIYTFGHRNAQGIALRPGTDEVWMHEHGPAGGDEINILKAGANYGWPEVSDGNHYSGVPIEDHGSSGYEKPLLHWTPSIAPSGMAFYTGDKIPAWQGDLFVGALAGQHLRRIDLDDSGSVQGQEELLGDLGERIRDVVDGPDGHLYIVTDSPDGRVLRLEPQP